MMPNKKVEQIVDPGTRQRIMDVSIHLFAIKGYDATSIREIAREANVNVASINYHFSSKENLRRELMEYVLNGFKSRISSISPVNSAADYAVKVFETLTEDTARCLNQFKLVLEAETPFCDTEPYPIGYEQFSVYLAKELNSNVPQSERLWLVNVVFSYVIHISVMSSTDVGKKTIEKFFPRKRDSIPVYISQLVKSLIRDLNNQYL